MENIKTTVMFLVWARLFQQLVCNQENQKHIRGLIGLITVCMILTPFHKNGSAGINQMIEEQFSEQEMENNKITDAFWKNCEEMIDEEMDGQAWREHFEEEESMMTEEEKDGYEENNIERIKIRVLSK